MPLSKCRILVKPERLEHRDRLGGAGARLAVDQHRRVLVPLRRNGLELIERHVLGAGDVAALELADRAHVDDSHAIGRGLLDALDVDDGGARRRPA